MLDREGGHQSSDSHKAEKNAYTQRGEGEGNGLIHVKTQEMIMFRLLRKWMDFWDTAFMTVVNVVQNGWETAATAMPILRNKNFTDATIVIGFYAVCIAFYMHEEEWDFLDSLYFITCTISTIGYGDMYPTTDSSRWFTIFVILIGIFGVTIILANFFGSLIKKLIDNWIDYLYPNDLDSDDDATAPTHYVAKIGIVLFLFFSISIVSVMFLVIEHDETILIGLYWTVVSITSVGYGDVSLTSDNEKIFVIVFVLAALFLVSAGVGIIFDTLEKERIRKENERILDPTQIDMTTLQEFDDLVDGVKGVDRFTFMIGMLVKTQVLDKKKNVDFWLNKFEIYDKDESDYLTVSDFKRIQEERDEEASSRKTQSEDQIKEDMKRRKGRRHRHNGLIQGNICKLMAEIYSKSGMSELEMMNGNMVNKDEGASEINKILSYYFDDITKGIKTNADFMTNYEVNKNDKFIATSVIITNSTVVKTKPGEFNCIISLYDDTTLDFPGTLDYNMRAGDMMIIKDEEVKTSEGKAYMLLPLGLSAMSI